MSFYDPGYNSIYIFFLFKEYQIVLYNFFFWQAKVLIRTLFINLGRISYVIARVSRLSFSNT